MNNTKRKVSKGLISLLVLSFVFLAGYIASLIVLCSNTGDFGTAFQMHFDYTKYLFSFEYNFFTNPEFVGHIFSGFLYFFLALTAACFVSGLIICIVKKRFFLIPCIVLTLLAFFVYMLVASGYWIYYGIFQTIEFQPVASTVSTICILVFGLLTLIFSYITFFRCLYESVSRAYNYPRANQANRAGPQGMYGQPTIQPLPTPMPQPQPGRASGEDKEGLKSMLREVVRDIVRDEIARNNANSSRSDFNPMAGGSITGATFGGPLVVQYFNGGINSPAQPAAPAQEEKKDEPAPQPEPQPEPQPAPVEEPVPVPQPEPMPAPQPEPQPVYQQPVYEQPAPMPEPQPAPQPEPAPVPQPVYEQPQMIYQQPVYEQPAPMPAPQPEPASMPEPMPAPQPEPQPVYQQPVYEQPAPQPVYEQPAPMPEPAPVPQPEPYPNPYMQQPYAEPYMQPEPQPDPYMQQGMYPPPQDPYQNPYMQPQYNAPAPMPEPAPMPAPMPAPAPAPVPQPEPAPAPQPAPAPVVEPEQPAEEKKPIIRIPFTERMINADEEMKNNYNELKNEILSYGVNSRVSNSGDTFRLHRKTYVKLTIAGLSLKLYFALDPEDYKDSRLPVQNAGHKGIYNEIPLVFKVRSGLSMRRCKQLIQDVMEKDGLEQGEVRDINWAEELKLAPQSENGEEL